MRGLYALGNQSGGRLRVWNYGYGCDTEQVQRGPRRNRVIRVFNFLGSEARLQCHHELVPWGGLGRKFVP